MSCALYLRSALACCGCSGEPRLSRACFCADCSSLFEARIWCWKQPTLIGKMQVSNSAKRRLGFIVSYNANIVFFAVVAILVLRSWFVVVVVAVCCCWVVAAVVVAGSIQWLVVSLLDLLYVWNAEASPLFTISWLISCCLLWAVEILRFFFLSYYCFKNACSLIFDICGQWINVQSWQAKAKLICELAANFGRSSPKCPKAAQTNVCRSNARQFNSLRMQATSRCAQLGVFLPLVASSARAQIALCCCLAHNLRARLRAKYALLESRISANSQLIN